jgi:hypothetical protein
VKHAHRGRRRCAPSPRIKPKRERIADEDLKGSAARVDGKKLERDLPLDKPVEVAVTFPKAGKLGYACSMNMAKGVIFVQ